MIKAKVRWFDNLSQDGMIRMPDGTSVYVNNDPVYGCLLMKGVKLSLKSGDSVLVEVFEDTTFRQISKLEVIK